MPDPAIGEVRTSNGETRSWDGSAWKLVPRTFLGTEDFTGRMKDYAGPLVKTIASDIAQPIMHPADTAAGVVNAVSHPAQTLGDIGDFGKRLLVEGQPEDVGHVISAAAAPKVYGGVLKGFNSGAETLANNPAVRTRTGTIGGMIGGQMVGGGWGPRIIGGAIGGALGDKLLAGPSQVAADASGYVMDRLGMKSSTPELPAKPTIADLRAKGLVPKDPNVGTSAPPYTGPTDANPYRPVSKIASEATPEAPRPTGPTVPPEVSRLQSTWEQAAKARTQQLSAAEPFMQAVELGAPKGSYGANFVKSLREQIANGRNLSESQMQTLQNLSTQLPADTQQTILRLLTEQMSQK
jgi:hypothetical protein